MREWGHPIRGRLLLVVVVIGRMEELLLLLLLALLLVEQASAGPVGRVIHELSGQRDG